MLKKKQVISMVSISVISLLIGTMLKVNLLTTAKDEDDGRPVWITYVTGVNTSALPDVWKVNATNLTVDEEGNLRVTQANGDQNVIVTNFPLDEQGDLKVSSGASKVVTVERDLKLGYPASHLTRHFTSMPMEVEGFSELYVYVSIKNWTSNVDLWCYPISIVDGIESSIPCENGWWTIEASRPWDGTPLDVSARYYVWGPTVRIEGDVRAEAHGGWLLVSISIYLRN